MRGITTIRPGLLVGLKTQVRGGVHYDRRDLEESQDGAEKRWETLRTIEDPAEHEAAGKVRQQACSTIRRVCAATSFGLLCPDDKEAELDAAIASARRMASAHNLGASTTEVRVFVLKGRVASSDAEAARAIAADMAELIATMQTGIRSMDPAAIRDAAARARVAAAMLGDAEKGRVERAVDVARKAARTIVRRIEKAHEDVALVMRELESEAIQPLRMTYLDFCNDEPGEAIAPLPAVALQRFADVDAQPHDAEDAARAEEHSMEVPDAV